MQQRSLPLLFILTLVAMTAFAANSLLNRAALLDTEIGPASYSLIRVFAGALTLYLLLALKHKKLRMLERPDPAGIIGLSLYLIGFSYAYISMDTGLGALVLFGGVQITMFGRAVFEGEKPPIARWLGMALSFTGLCLLVWPSDDLQINFTAFLLMAVAAIGWGIYSLAGRKVKDSLGATCWNFIYTTPLIGIFWLLLASNETQDEKGILLAIISGAITSGMGYALWYAILPQLGATIASLAQLSVPVIAVILGFIFLAEIPSSVTMIAAALILLGILIGILAPRWIKKRKAPLQ